MSIEWDEQDGSRWIAVIDSFREMEIVCASRQNLFTPENRAVAGAGKETGWTCVMSSA